MRQNHLKGKEMKPLCRLWKAILKSYKSAVLECYSFQLFLFIYLFLSCVVFSLFHQSALRDRTKEYDQINYAGMILAILQSQHRA